MKIEQFFAPAAEHPHFVRRNELVSIIRTSLSPRKRKAAHRELLELEREFDRWWQEGGSLRSEP